MFSRAWYRFAGRSLAWVFIGIAVSVAAAFANDDCNIYGCPDDCQFTQDFRLNDCLFKSNDVNPFFILKPGYRAILETPEEEKSVETVLCDIKWINLDGRRIKTRVVEERAFEWDGGDEENGEGEWVAVEISRNYFAICKRTNAVYYFGESSRDCPDGFDENDVCTGEESNEGSWEAGVDGARPGLMMPGTPLLGAKYFQEIAFLQGAVDRGEIRELGVEVEVPAGKWSDCIRINDTNPIEGACGDEDAKLYCPGIGLVQDQDLELVWHGFVNCKNHDYDLNE